MRACTLCGIICGMSSMRFLLVALLGAVQSTAAPQPPGAGGAKPAIKFEKLLHDFGRVKETDVLRHEFIITNTGTAPLEVLDVKPGCPSCTTALPWDRKVEPGKTGKIPIEFRTRGFSGTVSKSITVTCNDPLSSVHNIQVQATVWKPVDVIPAYVYFLGVEGEVTNDTKVVRIANNMEEPLALEPAQSNNPNFKTELKTLNPGRVFELHVLYSPTATNALPQGIITLKTSSTNMPVLSVTAVAIPQPAVVAMPQTVRLPAGPLNPDYRQPVTIRNNSSKPIALSDATVSAEGVTVQTAETYPGKLFTLNLSFASNFNAHPDKPMELTVKTTHPRYPLLRLPIIQPATIPANVQTRPPAKPNN
jgi:hypothetical protein